MWRWRPSRSVEDPPIEDDYGWAHRTYGRHERIDPGENRDLGFPFRVFGVFRGSSPVYPDFNFVLFREFSGQLSLDRDPRKA